MDDEFYATIKLVSGEELFGIVAPCIENDEQYLIVSNPIMMKKVYVNDSLYTYKVEPWLKLTEENLFILEKSKILTVIECFNRQLIQIHNVYLNSLEESTITGNYKLTRQDGYIDNVKQVKSKLERIFKSS
jgi:hypothetical protein